MIERLRKLLRKKKPHYKLLSVVKIQIGMKVYVKGYVKNPVVIEINRTNSEYVGFVFKTFPDWCPDGVLIAGYHISEKLWVQENNHD